MPLPLPTQQTSKQIVPLPGNEFRGMAATTEESLRKRAIGAGFEALEQLRRPQSALFQATMSRIQGASGPEALEEGLREFRYFENRPTFKDLWAVGGLPEVPYQGLVNFMGDVLVDPLWFVPGAAIVAPFKGALKVGYGGILALEKLGIPTEKALKSLQKAFTGAASKAGREAQQKIFRASRETRLSAETILAQERALQKEIKAIAKEFGEEVVEVERAITAGIEASHSAVNGLPLARAFVDDIAATTDDIVDWTGLQEAILSSGPFDPTPYLSKLSPGAKLRVLEVVGERKPIFSAIEELRKGANLTVKESERLDYALHMIHPKAKQALILSPEFSKFGRTWGPRHSKRLLDLVGENVSISEVNSLALQGRLELLGLPKGVPLFIDNPAAIEALGMYRTARAIASEKMFDELVKDFGLILPDLAEHVPGGVAHSSIVAQKKLMLSQGMRPMSAKGKENVWLHKEVADLVDEYFKIADDAKRISKFEKAWTDTQNVWKAWTLAVFPEYHTRNLVGNIWNNFLAGMHVTQPYYTAMAVHLNAIKSGTRATPETVKKLLASVPKELHGSEVHSLLKLFTGGKSLDDTIKIRGISYTYRELIDSMAEAGVMRGGIFGAEVERASTAVGALAKTRSTARQVAIGTIGPVNFGFKVAQQIEDSSRIAHFLWRLSKGDSVKEAGESVAKFLFNYDEIDPLTRKARTVMPFLTWSRKNIPLQLEHLIKDPAKASIINKARQSIESRAGTDQALDERYVLEYVRTGMGIRTRRKAGGEYEVFLLNNWIPFADLAEVGTFEIEKGIGSLADKAGHWAFNLLSPGITIPAETVFGKSMFLGRDFYPEGREFMGLDLPERLSNALRAIRILSVLDRFIGINPNTTVQKEVIRTLTGIRTVDIDLTKGKRGFRAEVSKKQRELLSARKRALRRGDREQAQKIAKELKEFLKESSKRQRR